MHPIPEDEMDRDPLRMSMSAHSDFKLNTALDLIRRLGV